MSAETIHGYVPMGGASTVKEATVASASPVSKLTFSHSSVKVKALYVQKNAEKRK